MKCSPWQVSDVAMEEILDQTIRRGWRAPNQGEAFTGLDILPAIGLVVIDANAPMPVRQKQTLSDQETKDTAAGDVQETPADPVIPADMHEPTNTTPQPMQPPA